MPAAPQSHASLTAHGRSAWSSQTHPTSWQMVHFIDQTILNGSESWDRSIASCRSTTSCRNAGTSRSCRSQRRRNSIATSAETSRDHPGSVERKDAYRIFVLALQQIGDHGLEVSHIEVGFAPDPAEPAQIVHHQEDIMVIPAGNNRRGPVGSMHYKTSRKNPDSSAVLVIRS
jgi:hypothetical protein